MGPVKITDRNIVSVLAGGSAILLLVLALGGTLFGSLKFGASILTGGVLALANFFWLASALRRVLQLPVATAGKFANLRYLLRLAVMGVILYLLIVHAGVDVIGLILGLSVIVVTVTVLALYTLTCKGGYK